MKDIINKLTEKAKRSEVKIQVAAGGVTDSGLFVWGINTKVKLQSPYFHTTDSYTLHAEMAVLLKLLKKNLVLERLFIVAPKNTKEGYRPSKPCTQCLHFLKETGRVKKIVFYSEITDDFVEVDLSTLDIVYDTI